MIIGLFLSMVLDIWWSFFNMKTHVPLLENIQKLFC